MILDTDFIILYMKKDTKTLEKFGELIDSGAELCTTHVTAWELYRGAYISSQKDENIQKINKFLNYIPILPFTRNTDERFAELFVKLEKLGDHIGVMDALIASIALEYDLPILTRNIKHFKKTDTKIESW